MLASRIDGNVGLLGGDYPGYFSVGDTHAFARLVQRLEHQPQFVARLRKALAGRAPLFRQVRETTALRRLLAEFKCHCPAGAIF